MKGKHFDLDHQYHYDHQDHYDHFDLKNLSYVKHLLEELEEALIASDLLGRVHQRVRLFLGESRGTP